MESSQKKDKLLRGTEPLIEKINMKLEAIGNICDIPKSDKKISLVTSVGSESVFERIMMLSNQIDLWESTVKEVKERQDARE